MKEHETEEKKGQELKMEQINETKPIWKKSKSEIKSEDYNEFYKNISMDFNEPL